MAAVVLLGAAVPSLVKAAPDFGPNVLIFDPLMTDIQPRIDKIFKTQERGEFNSNRYAYLFKPGKYSLDVQVGYYMQVVGLGESPDDVVITGAVRSKAGWHKGNATVNFWRAVENLSIEPTLEGKANVWAVSQGTALRRLHVRGDLNLSDHGWSSGGFLSDCKIDGTVDAGTQQQWIARNAEWANWIHGDWNMVFVGCPNVPAGQWPDKPWTAVDTTPLICEKPYLTIDSSGNYFVKVPKLRTGARGVTWNRGLTPADSIPINRFYIASSGHDTAATINAALDSGMNLLLTPGIYHLESSLKIIRPDTIILGLGYPTLIPDRGTSAIEVADVDGVKLGGLLLEAGPINSPTLLRVGDKRGTVSHSNDPIFLYDIFARAGGAAVGKTTAFVVLNSNNVVGDNIWLWRADHGTGTSWEQNTNPNGIVVNGNDVTLYGLFVEHCQEYQTIWNGNGGQLFFYQSEMPYQPPSQEAWSHDGVKGYASYKIGDGVTSHQAFGLGVYCVFVSVPVVAENSIEAPVVPGVELHHLTTLRFGGLAGSGISHVLNGQGTQVITSKYARLN